MWATFNLGIEINLTMKQASQGSHQGACDMDIKDLRNVPSIKRQLNKLDSELLKRELKEYGAWDETELSNHDENLDRILWIACGDIVESKNN
jgi:hypothetical protein